MVRVSPNRLFSYEFMGAPSLRSMKEHPLQERLEQLEERKEKARHPGSEQAVQRQRDRGKMLARERVEYLLDDGSFHELDMLARHRSPDIAERPYTDGVITGWGTIDGRQVFVFSQDFTLFGGALGEVFADKIHKVMDLALKVGAPLIGINDGAVGIPGAFFYADEDAFARDLTRLAMIEGIHDALESIRVIEDPPVRTERGSVGNHVATIAR